VLRAFDDIAADDSALVGRDRRKLRRGEQVACRINGRIGRRAQKFVDRDAPLLMRDLAGLEVQLVDIGDAAGAIDHAIGLDRPLGAALLVDNAQTVAGFSDADGLHARTDRDADAFAFGPYPLDRVGVHVAEQPRQHFEDRDLRAGSGVDVAELERDDAAAHEHDLARHRRLAQHVLRRDHVFGALYRQRARPGPGRDRDALGLDLPVADAHGVGAGETGAPAHDVDTALRHRARERFRDVADHLLLALDQRGPVETRLPDGDAMDLGALDRVQRVRRCDQDLLGHAAAVGTRPAEIALLDDSDRQTGLARRHRRRDAGIAGTQNQHVVGLDGHGLLRELDRCPDESGRAFCTHEDGSAGAPYWTRTSDLPLRRRLLYPAELRAPRGGRPYHRTRS
jgi:hypothetical protein